MPSPAYQREATRGPSAETSTSLHGAVPDRSSALACPAPRANPLPHTRTRLPPAAAPVRARSRAPLTPAAARRPGYRPARSRRRRGSSSRSVIALVVREVLAGPDALPPAAVLHVPLYGARQPLAEGDARCPAQLAAR